MAEVISCIAAIHVTIERTEDGLFEIEIDIENVDGVHITQKKSTRSPAPHFHMDFDARNAPRWQHGNKVYRYVRTEIEINPESSGKYFVIAKHKFDNGKVSTTSNLIDGSSFVFTFSNPPKDGN